LRSTRETKLEVIEGGPNDIPPAVGEEHAVGCLPALQRVTIDREPVAIVEFLKKHLK
jgi:hypothetical protein